MCGIVGILGSHEAAPLLVDALKRLEYRGYDSAGIATVRGGELDRRRAVGKLVNLSDLLVHDPLLGQVGIGHTRWATHGSATVENAHPHQASTVAVVHNGIIENYRELKTELNGHGYGFETETDTETISVLCQRFLDEGHSPPEAARLTIKRLTGAFAVCFLFSTDDDLIFVARRGSPLAVGYGNGEMFVASDAHALSCFTESVTYLEEGDCAEVTRARISIYDAANQPVERAVLQVKLESGAAEKGAYKHFMAKEIFEQPSAVAEAAGQLSAEIASGQGDLANLDFTAFERVQMVACGTAYYAGCVACYWFEQFAGLPAQAEIASEFRYRGRLLGSGDLSVFVSQSGETADTIAALRYVRNTEASNLSILNNMSSTMARESEVAMPIHAGPEIGVASSKAFTCQLATLVALAIWAGEQRGQLEAAAAGDLANQLKAVPGLLNAVLSMEEEIACIARQIADSTSALFIGRGSMYPIALEGALKLKELSYIHAEGLAGGELKHGPIALVDKTLPVFVLAPSGPLFEKTMSNLEEVKARGGRIVLITDSEGAKKANDSIWKSLVMPTVNPLFAPIVYAVPMQLVAYHAAVEKGTDVDQPRNLAKSVTVE